jgi:hypothetical protein
LFDSITNLNFEVKSLITGIAGQNLVFLMKKVIAEHAKLREISLKKIQKGISGVETKS